MLSDPLFHFHQHASSASARAELAARVAESATGRCGSRPAPPTASHAGAAGPSAGSGGRGPKLAAALKTACSSSPWPEAGAGLHISGEYPALLLI